MIYGVFYAMGVWHVTLIYFLIVISSPLGFGRELQGNVGFFLMLGNLGSAMGFFPLFKRFYPMAECFWKCQEAYLANGRIFEEVGHDLGVVQKMIVEEVRFYAVWFVELVLNAYYICIEQL